MSCSEAAGRGDVTSEASNVGKMSCSEAAGRGDVINNDVLVDYNGGFETLHKLYRCDAKLR